VPVGYAQRSGDQASDQTATLDDQQAPGPDKRAADANAGDAALRRMASNGQAQAITRTVDGVRIYAPAGVDPSAVDRAAEMVHQEVGRNQFAQRQLERQHIGLVIIPAHSKMTDMPEFASLHGQHTFDGARTWDNVRGEGSARLPDGTYACAVGEEQLVDVPDVLRNYAPGYSVGMHEFAHTVTIHAMTSDQKAPVTRLYQQHAARDPGNRGGTWTDDYASSNEQEYFAQATNCFFGKNEGAYTSQSTHQYTRNNNGREWLQANDPEMYAFLVSLYDHDHDPSGRDVGAGTGGGGGGAPRSRWHRAASACSTAPR
jgi:hypothetical protein